VRAVGQATAGGADVPLEGPVRVVVIFGDLPVGTHSYDPLDPIVEILADVGVIKDERQAEEQQMDFDANLGNRYTVMVEPLVGE
jgi:hypothetical protein